MSKPTDAVTGHQAEPIIKAWVAEHEKRQRAGSALTDGLKPAESYVEEAQKPKDETQQGR